MPLMRLRGRCLLWMGVLSALGFGPALGEQVVLIPSRDNTLFESDTGSTSDGAGEYLFAGRTAQGSDAIRRAVLAFDLAGQVPAGSKVLKASLTLNMSRTQTGAVEVKLHRVTADWGEGASDSGIRGGIGAPSQPPDATWIHRFFPDVLWDEPGGDFDFVTPSAAVPVAGMAPYTWGSTPQMVADVQRWVDQPGQNFGWILVGPETGFQTSKRFDSRDNLTEANRPRLMIEFEPPEPVPVLPGSGVVVLALLLGAGGWRLAAERLRYARSGAAPL